MTISIIYNFACKLIQTRFYQNMPPRVRGGYLQLGGSVRRRRYNLRKRRRNERGKGIGTKSLAMLAKISLPLLGI